MKKQSKNILLALAGLALLAVGLCLVHKTYLAYLCIGVGCGLFGHGTGELWALHTARTNPEAAKMLEIAQKDERNVAIANCAKGKAFDMMTFLFGALFIAFAAMQVEAPVLLILVSAYLLVQGYAVYWRVRLEKEM